MISTELTLEGREIADLNQKFGHLLSEEHKCEELSEERRAELKALFPFYKEYQGLDEEGVLGDTTEFEIAEIEYPWIDGDISARMFVVVNVSVSDRVRDARGWRLICL